MSKQYVTGIGWCHMEDGEIIEVIETVEEESPMSTVRFDNPMGHWQLVDACPYEE